MEFLGLILYVESIFMVKSEQLKHAKFDKNNTFNNKNNIKFLKLPYLSHSTYTRPQIYLKISRISSFKLNFNVESIFADFGTIETSKKRLMFNIPGG